MRFVLPFLLTATLFIAGCSSSYNPVNWFGGDRPEDDNFTPIEETNPLIPQSEGNFITEGRDERNRYRGVPIDRVTTVATERVPDGLIIKVTGMSNTQGVYDARLIPVSPDEKPEDGVLVYSLHALNDVNQRVQGSAKTREVIVARKRTDQELGNTRVIRIESATNALEVRR